MGGGFEKDAVVPTGQSDTGIVSDVRQPAGADGVWTLRPERAFPMTLSIEIVMKGSIMAGLRRTGSLLVIALMPGVFTGCASTSSRLATLQKKSADSQEQIWTRAQLSEHEGRFAEAQQHYAELCRLDPKSPVYAHRLGVVSTMLSDHDRAWGAYERAKELDPNNTELLADMGYAAYLQRDYVQAESLLKASLAKSPNNPRAKSNLALAIGCQGRYDECQALFREVHGQDQAEILCNLAYVKSQRGDVVDAVALYKQVLAIDPKFIKAATALAQLKSADAAVQTVAQQKPYHKYMQKASLDPAPPAVAAAPEASAAALDEAPDFVATQVAATQDAATEASVASVTVQPMAAPPQTRPVAKLKIPAGTAAQMTALDCDEPASTVVQTADQFVHEPAVAEVVEFDDPAPWTEAEPGVTSDPSPLQARQFPLESAHAATSKPESSEPRPIKIKPAVSAKALTAVVAAPAQASVPPQCDAKSTKHVGAPRELAGDWTGSETGINEQFGAEWLSTREEQLKARSGQAGFMGFCPVALRDELKLIDALPQYTAEHQSQKFQFSSEEAMKKFLAKPERYLPAAGGLDVVAVSQGTAVAQGSLEHALWFRKKLYLFLSRENMELFRIQARELAVQE